MYTFNVPKMSCGGCVNNIKKAIMQLDQSAVIEVDLATRKVNVKSDISEQAIAEAMSDAGYKPM
ncbi:MAG: heavy metal transporter [Proteobacteria bacterium ST_bin12]|jgi:copper chaperone|nr:MAG: heavy metal transporter [Proteobacteria bacterium ST_bin12]